MKEVMLSAEPSETVREEVTWNLPVGFALVREARVVAIGVSFPTAGAVIQWLGEHRSTVVWPDLTDAMVVHGHEGTELIWDDRVAIARQDAHTPREQPQTRSGGTESGEGGGGAQKGVRVVRIGGRQHGKTTTALLAENDALRAQVERVRALAEEWAAKAPADDWGDDMAETFVADAGRRILAALDGASSEAGGNGEAGA